MEDRNKIEFDFADIEKEKKTTKRVRIYKQEDTTIRLLKTLDHENSNEIVDSSSIESA